MHLNENKLELKLYLKPYSNFIRKKSELSQNKNKSRLEMELTSKYKIK